MSEAIQCLPNVEEGNSDDWCVENLTRVLISNKILKFIGNINNKMIESKIICNKNLILHACVLKH